MKTATPLALAAALAALLPTSLAFHGSSPSLRLPSTRMQHHALTQHRAPSPSSSSSSFTSLSTITRRKRPSPSSLLHATAAIHTQQSPQEKRRKWPLSFPSLRSSNKSKKLQIILTALPVVLLLTVVLAGGPAAVHAAAASAAATTSNQPARVNKVKEYILRPLGDAARGPVNALSSSTHSIFQWLTQGPLGQFLANAWNEPAARYMLDTSTTPLSPNDIPGHVLEAIQARLPPTWSPLMVVCVLSFLPIFEARVGVPFGLALGAPWLKALVLGVAANSLAIPLAAGLGAFFRDVGEADPFIEEATAARERYQDLERHYQEVLGKLALKKAQLEDEEVQLRTTIDTAIACVRKGDILMDMATRQGLVKDITEASRILLSLSASDATQFQQRLEEQFFGTTVGSVMLDNNDQAFDDISVAALGQRRLEVGWHPDVTLFPALGQAVATYQLEELAAQADFDFGVRVRELVLLREEVGELEGAAGRATALRVAAKKEAEMGRETVQVAREIEEGVLTSDDKSAARKRAVADATAAREAAAEQAKGGPGKFVSIEEKEKEEESRIATLQMKGKMMMNYSWPKAIVYVGLPLPFSGAWTAMFWSACFGMKFGPSALGAWVGVMVSTLIGLGLWLTGPVGVLVYALFLAVLYGAESPLVVVGKAWASLVDTLFGGWGKGKGKGKK